MVNIIDGEGAGDSESETDPVAVASVDAEALRVPSCETDVVEVNVPSLKEGDISADREASAEELAD